MGFLRVVKRKKHDCILPDKSNYDEGTIWQCGDCGKIYELYNANPHTITPYTALWQEKFLLWRDCTKEYNNTVRNIVG